MAMFCSLLTVWSYFFFQKHKLLGCTKRENNEVFPKGGKKGMTVKDTKHLGIWYKSRTENEALDSHEDRHKLSQTLWVSAQYGSSWIL